MRLALIGYGRMGKTIESLASARGHEIVAIIDPAFPRRKSRASQSGSRKSRAQARDLLPPPPSDLRFSHRLTTKAVENADVCLEFTHPKVAAGNLLRLCRMGKRVVVGTTGWYERLDEVAGVAEAKKAAVLYGSNFSIGVNLFFRLVERAAQLYGRLDDRDIFLAETHHRAKVDAPSGTARRLSEIILANCPSKSRSAPAQLDGAIAPDQLQTVSVRAGWVPGTHRVGIESPHDSITLEHRAHSREGFAEGALRAAEWLAAAPPGLYRFDDVLDDVLGR